MNYIRVLGGFVHHKDNKLLVEADIILSSMSGNPTFPTPTPSLEEIENAYNEYATYLARANWTHGRIDRELKRESKVKLSQLLGQLAGYVNYVAKGELSILYSSGFPVFTGRKKGTVPEVPTGGRLSDGRVSDELYFDFNSLGRDMTYEYTYAIWISREDAPPESSELQWEQSLFTTRSRKNLIKSVPSRSTVFAKVRAINRHGVGDWSAVVSLRVR
ncbi:hypothetical protein [Sphingobacterium corticibacterium]|uniref:Fibronectin type-III domain-containing protein n=1 Tax=Sphingobacterium corticibacterium TaxID=2484746 RepID=A0A4Q6Y0D5_9SPHI|nr:hypothetical protein [Sphingobacterium corticibacterium]RZF62669.1 hypothetical protein EWE74_07740 [Sphingobacterium corticibacterium]